VKKGRVLAVVDRNVSRGLNEGAVYTEIKSTLFNHSHETKVIGFIAGLKGNDLWDSDFRYMLNKALKVGQGLEPTDEAEWVPKVNVKLKTLSEKVPEKLYYSGSGSCPGCGMALAFRHLVDTIGKNMIMVRTAGCQAWTSTSPGRTCAGIPLGRAVLPGGASLAAGLARALESKGEKDDVEVVLFGGDGSVGDMGMLALSGAAERNEDILVVVYDNEAYANTGMQRSGATPKFASTTTTPVGAKGRGEKRAAKDLTLIMAAHKVPYVATASVSHTDDLRKKLKKAKKIKGFRYIHIYIPCTTSWGFPPEDSISLDRLGVETCMHPLYEIEKGELSVTYTPENKVYVKEYLMQQKRFKHMTEDEIQIMQNEADHKWEELLKYEQCGLSLFSE
jgi:pyruvate ferredoxin oxidoreductase beta subunit